MIAAINRAMDLKAWIEVLFSTVLTGSTLYVAWKQYALEKRRDSRARRRSRRHE